jgi:predicted permease
MTWLHRLLRRQRLERALDAELRDHFDRLVADFRREGLDDSEARRRARLEFGGLDQVKELCRDARGTRWAEELAQDLRYGSRGLRKHPTFAVVAVTALALGVAATMTVFNLVEALLLRPLPVPSAGELVTLIRWQAGLSSDHFSYPQVRALAERGDLFSAFAGMGSDTVNVGPPDALAPTGAAWVSGGYFDVLRVQPLAGRLLTSSDDQAGAVPAAVISYDYWQRRFGGDLMAVGGHVLLEGMAVPIVGVTPRGFTGATVGERVDITLAIAARPRLQPENDGFLTPSSRWLRVLGRPARGLTPGQLRAALDVVWPSILEATLPSGINAETRARTLTMTVALQPGAQGTSRIRERFRLPLIVAMAMVVFVLVIACVNVATLLLARGATRSHEIALRLAIGAGRGRIVRQLLTESALVACIGTAIGLVLGVAGSRAVVALLATSVSGPEANIVWLPVMLNWHVAAAASVLIIGTTITFGLVPALRASVSAPGMVALSISRVAIGPGRLATTLIVAQVALSVALIGGAGLFARTLLYLRTLDRGFRTDNVVLVSFDPTRALRSAADLREFNREVLAAVERLPGMSAVTLAAVTPLQGGGMSAPAFVNGVSTNTEEVYFNVVGPRYFEIMNTPLLQGREFASTDDLGRPAVAVVNEAFVRRHVDRGPVLGQRVSFSTTGGEMQIVGVVRDAVYETLRAAAPPTVYTCYLQQRGRRMTLVIDSDAGPAAATAAVRAVVQPKVPAQPLVVRTLAAQVDHSLIRERLMALLAGLFAALALILAAIGLYGLIAFAVTSRAREIGVRLALGARHHMILRSVLQNAVRMVATGIAIGLPVMWLLSNAVRGLIVGVTPTDPLTLIATIGALMATGVVAALGPARRASRIDPVVSLRSE